MGSKCFIVKTFTKKWCFRMNYVSDIPVDILGFYRGLPST